MGSFKEDFLMDIDNIDKEIISITQDALNLGKSSKKDTQIKAKLNSIELQKKELAQKIVEISKKEIQAKQKEDFIRVCNSIIDANKLIRKIINAENNQVKVEKNLIEKEIKLDETAELDK